MSGANSRPEKFPWSASLLITAIAGLAAIAAVVYFLYATAAPKNTLVMDVVYFCATQDSQAPNAESNCWQSVYLPHDWQKSGYEELHGWYRFGLELKVPPNRLWSIYLPRVTSNALVKINGEFVGHGGRFEDPVARNWSRPLNFSIPSGILRNGENSFSIYVKAAPGSPGYLGRIHLGPEEAIRPAYQRNHGFRVDTVESINFSLVLVAILILGHWATRPRDMLHVWFASLAILWALHNLNLLVVEIPFSVRAWETLRHLTLGWFIVVLIFCMHAFIGVDGKRIERIVAAVMAFASIAMLLMPAEASFVWYSEHVFLRICTLLGIYPAYRVLQRWWETWNPEYLIAIFAGTPILLAGVHDLARVSGYVSRENGFFIQYSAPILVLGFTIVLLIRFARALNESEALNLSLERRVESKRIELENNYTRLAELERSQTLAAERERIMRDMHDGVGGQLVSALALSQSTTTSTQEIQSLLSDALLDLRLMIDSMEQNDGDLVSLLGSIRSRMQPALAKEGIEVIWDVRDIPVISQLSADRSLQILRILQESITNAIRHSKATQLRISTGSNENVVYMEISDDGIGFDPTSLGKKRGGRGLENMKHRARMASTQLTVDSAPSGTTVRVTLPIGDTIPNVGDTPATYNA